MKTTLKRGASRNETNGVPVLPPGPLTQITRYGPPRRGVLSLVGRIVLWLLVVVLVALGGLVGGVWLWWEHSVAATAPSTPEERAAQEILDKVPAPDHPAVAIVIGYDRREGKERSLDTRSDTIMLLRADPRLKTISMLSFPRDLQVELAPCEGFPTRVGRINQAFTECGTKGTVQTVRKLTGVPINYFITVNFRSFIEIVDDLGGVYLDVDRRYFNDNDGLGPGQTFSAIDLHPGYQRLDGPDALAFVRYRHTDNDFYRNARQQEFVKAVKQQVSGLSAAWKLRGIVDAITSHVTVGQGGGKGLSPETVLSYAKLAYELPSGNLFQARIEGLSSNAYFDVLAPEAEVDAAVEEFMNPDPEAAQKAASATVGEKPKSRIRKGPPPSAVTVEVLNGNGVAGAAGEAAYLLDKRGYKAVSGGNAGRQNYFKTTILYDAGREGGKGAAEDMAKLFGDAEVVVATPEEGVETMLRVIVGQTFQGSLAPGPKDETPKHQPPKVEKDSSVIPLVRRQQRKVGFPLLAPTLRESSSSLSTLEGIRVYNLHGEKALRLVYNGPFATDYWGIQETGWTDAPVLDGASVTRKIGGREYRLFFNGAHLHVVAFEENGAAYWVTNTLLDGLSNETMLAIAKGLRAVRRS
jgi:LCP family protein required for cell wall assembly